MAPLPSRPLLIGAGAAAAVGALYLLGPLFLGGTASTSTVYASTASTASTGERPLVWPLGSDGYVPCELYDSHGQYLYVEGWYSTPSTHKGIDMGACRGDSVYAVAAGKVLDVDEKNPEYVTVVVTDGDSLTQAYKYQHLREVQVGRDDRVERDQLLGYVETFSAFCGFEHLHFQKVGYEWITNSDGEEVLDEWDDGNPLPLFPAREDAAAPVAAAVDVTGLPADPFTLYDEDWNELVSDSATGKFILDGKIHVVARAWETFPGDGPAFCPTRECCEAGFSTLIAPYRLSLSVLKPVDPADDLALPRTVFEPVYQHTIELAAANVDADGLAGDLYHESTANYSERDLRFVLTHGKDLELSPTTSDVYRFELLVEDTSGNVAVQRMEVKVGS